LADAAATLSRHPEFQKSGLSAVGIATFFPGKYTRELSAQTNSGHSPNAGGGSKLVKDK
jgi:hypothetical protein